jgi:hypothetical protein
MRKKTSIGLKLIGGFSVATLLTLAVGVIGWTGARGLMSEIQEIGGVRLRSVQTLLEIDSTFESLRVAQRTLLNPDLNLEDRKRQFSNFDKAVEKYQKAWSVYKTLPHTEEESEVFKRFVPAFEAWKVENVKFLNMNKELEKTGILNPLSLKQEIERFRGDHYRALSKVAEMIQTGQVFEGGEDSQGCSMGQWLSTFRSDNTQLNEIISPIKPSHDRFHQSVKRVKDLVRNEDRDAALAAYRQDVILTANETLKHFDALLEQVGISRGIYAEMTQQAMVACVAKQKEVLALLDQLVEINTELASHRVREGESEARWISGLTFSVMGGGAVLCLAIGIGLTLMITRPVRAVIGGLGDGADQVAGASGQVSSASQLLAQGASEQAAAVEETSSSLEEMASMTRQNAENAAEANQLMGSTLGVVGEASASMADLSKSMHEISQASEETQKIIKTIDEIAFQTNLLALNAAVEAARAGEAGAGFAVVADEVRNLAMRASEAAKNTANLIDQSVKRIQAGTQLAAQTGGAFERVTEGSQRIAGIIAEISAASVEQSQGIDQVNRAVSEMEKVIQQNAANAEESAASAEELNAQAEQMRAYVEALQLLVNGTRDVRPPATAAGTLGRKRQKVLSLNSWAPIPSGQPSVGRLRHAISIKGKQDGNGDGPAKERLSRAGNGSAEKIIPFEDLDTGGF